MTYRWLSVLIAAFLVLAGCDSSRVEHKELDTLCDPHGHNQYRFQHGKVILHRLPTAKTQMYLIYNYSQHPIVFNHITAHPSASAGWSSKLDSKKWSAIIVSKPKFALGCDIVQGDEAIRPSNCYLHVRLCVIKSKHSKGFKDTYWYLENFNSLKNFHDKLKAKNPLPYPY